MENNGRTWRKSSFSGPVGDCVQVRVVDTIAVRHSKDPEGPVLFFTLGEWKAFCAGVRDGQFDVRESGLGRG